MLRAGEQALIVVDEPLVDQGARLAAAIAQVGAGVAVEKWSATPPVEAGALADVLLFVAQRPAADEAGARMTLFESVLGHQGRVLVLAFVDRALLEGELSEPAVDVEDAARRLTARLDGRAELHVTGAAGTDLTFKIGGREWLTDAGVLKAGGLANFPAGEVFIAPHRDGADGVLVADLTVPFTGGGLVDEPVTITFERGRVTTIGGGRAAEALRTIVDEAGRDAGVIGELGIGLNPSIRPRGHVMLDEKAAGTAHVAIGRNTVFGGDNEASIHVDCVFSEPTLDLGGEQIAST